MGNGEIFSLLRAKLGTMFLSGLLCAALGFFGLMIVEKRYQASMDFLVVQTNVQSQDFYSLFKSSEYLGKVLSEAVYSERFITAVVDTGKVSNEFLPFDQRDRLKQWGKTVSVRKNLELGIIGVTVKDDQERDAARIMGAIAEVLTQKNALFRGGDEKSVEIRVLSGPIVERNPSLTDIAGVVAGGFVTGGALSALYVFSRFGAGSGRREINHNVFQAERNT